MIHSISLLILSLLLSTPNLRADSFLEPEKVENKVDKSLEGVGVVEQLGKNVDLNLEFKNEAGETVNLGKYFSTKKPVLLSMIYYTCPSLCNFQLNGLTEVMKQLEWLPGKEYEVVQVSIEPKETPELAQQKKNAYVDLFGKPEVAKGWHFLTGSQENITALAKQVGFQYKWVEETKEYAHSAASYVITPEGKISRYLYGIGFAPKTLRLSLVEASNGTIGTTLDQFILFCFQYDPKKRGYALYAFNIMRAAAGITVLLLGAFLFVFYRRQKFKLKE